MKRTIKRYYEAATPYGHRCVVKADNRRNAAFKAVEQFSREGIEPWDVGELLPEAHVPGYEFLLALQEEARSGEPFTTHLFVGSRDETGAHSPCCGCSGTFVAELGEWLAEHVEAPVTQH